MVGAMECRQVRSEYIPIVVAGKLAFRYDPARRIVEWQLRGEKHYIDLAVLEEMAARAEVQSKAQEGA